MWLIRDLLYLFVIIFTDSKSHEGVFLCDLRHVKEDESRSVWQNRLSFYLNCLRTVWSMKPLGKKGTFFFTSTWIFQVTPAFSRLCVGWRSVSPKKRAHNIRLFLGAALSQLISKVTHWLPPVMSLPPAQLKLGETLSSSTCCLFYILSLLPAFHTLCSFSYPLACIPHRTCVISGAGDFSCVFVA